jgi:hypothetical protein
VVIASASRREDSGFRVFRSLCIAVCTVVVKNLICIVIGGLSQRPNLTEGPAATWDFRRSIKEEEEEVYFEKNRFLENMF